MQKIVEATALQATKDKWRLQALERAVQSGGATNSGGGAPVTTAFVANTVVTVVDIGGNQVLVLFNHMFQKMREMESKVEVLLEQPRTWEYYYRGGVFRQRPNLFCSMLVRTRVEMVWRHS